MKRGSKTIIAGVAVMVVGCSAVVGTILVPAFTGAMTKAAFKSPGGTRIVIEEPGRYYLWNEYRTVHGGKSYNRPRALPDGIEFSIRDADGNPLELTTSDGTSVQVGNNAKQSIGYVDIDREGAVVIEATGGEGERVFSFSQLHVMKLVGRIFFALGLLALVGLLGIGLVIWGIVNVAKAGEPAALAVPAP